MYDIIFISYNEPNAASNWKSLIERFPSAHRVHGVKGIHQAHIQAAKTAWTKMFWVVDGDAIIKNDFDFSYMVPEWDLETVHVWRSQNPVNDLVYGYGGVKLLPKTLTINMDVNTTDMTTSISNKFKAMPEVSNITKFNTDEFSTWRSAYRECAKLSSNIIDRQNIDETQARLNIWKTVGADSQFGEFSLAGAIAGEEFGLSQQHNISLINDFDWLKEQFNASCK